MLTPVTVLPRKQQVQLDLDLVEVAPGERIVVPKPSNVRAPRHAVVVLEPTGDGRTFRPMLETHSTTVNIKEWDEKVFKISRRIIRILVLAGLVDGEILAPRSLTIHLESWFAYRERMRGNPFYWQDADNLKRYSDTAAAINRHERSRRKRRDSKSTPNPSTP